VILPDSLEALSAVNACIGSSYSRIQFHQWIIVRSPSGPLPTLEARVAMGSQCDPLGDDAVRVMLVVLAETIMVAVGWPKVETQSWCPNAWNRRDRRACEQ